MTDNDMTDTTDTTTATGTTTTTGTTTKRRPWQRSGGTGATGGTGGTGAEIAKIRTVVAQVLWGISVLFALILAVAVLLIAIEANADNDLVRWIIARAANVDLGFFSLTNPIKDFDEKKGAIDDVKTALFNYGIAAIVWLVVGKILEKVVKP